MKSLFGNSALHVALFVASLGAAAVVGRQVSRLEPPMAPRRLGQLPPPSRATCAVPDRLLHAISEAHFVACVKRSKICGVLVKRLDRNGVLRGLGLQEGDLVKRVNGQPLGGKSTRTDCVIQRVGRMVLTVWRQGHERTIVLFDPGCRGPSTEPRPRGRPHPPDGP